MTKLPTYIFLAIILLTTYSCVKRHDATDYENSMAIAKSLVDSIPDSALTVLRRIDMNCVTESAHEAEIRYLKGKAKRLLLDYPNAFRELIYAEKAAEDAKNYDLLALTRCQIITLYDSIDYTKGAYNYTLKAADAYEAARDSNNLFNKLSRYAMMNYWMEDTAELKTTYARLMRIFGESQDSVRQTKLWHISLCINEHFDSIEPTNTLRILADSIEAGGDIDDIFKCDTVIYMPYSIRNMAYRLFESDKDRDANRLLESYCKYYTCPQLGNNTDDGLIHLSKHLKMPFPFNGILLTRKNFFSNYKTSIERIRSEFYYEEIIIKEQTIRHQQQMLVVIVIAGMLIICIIILAFRMSNARRRRREEALIQSAAELKAAVNQTNHKWLSTLTHLCDTYYDAYARQSTKSKIAKSALAKINEAIDSAEFFPMLEKRLNQEKDGIMNKLRHEMPSLREDEYKLLMLNALGFSIPTLSLLMRENRDLIYTRRVRLRSKIQESAPSHAELFMQALS